MGTSYKDLQEYVSVEVTGWVIPSCVGIPCKPSNHIGNPSWHHQTAATPHLHMGHKIPKSYDIGATHRCQNSGVCTITFLLEQVGTSTSHLPPPVCSGPFELTCYSALYVTAKSGLVTKSCMNSQPKGKQKLCTFLRSATIYYGPYTISSTTDTRAG
jgi:hypothetical protein